MNDHIPPHGQHRSRAQQKREHHRQGVLGNFSVAKCFTVNRQFQRRARADQSGQQADAHIAGISLLHLRHPIGDWRTRFRLRQFGRHLRVDDGPADDVNQIEKCQKEAREHGRGIQLHHRLPGDGSVDNDHHRGWNQNTQRAAGSNDARCQTRVITGLEHRVEGDHAHQHHYCADQPAGNTPKGTDDQGGHGQRSRHAPKCQLHRVKHFVDQRASFHHIAHEHEQGNG